MILTDYYRFEKLPGSKSTLRVDATASTKGYDPIERYRKPGTGRLWWYVGKNTHTKPGREGRADLAISRTTHISSIYVPNPSRHPELAYGDMPATTDALIFLCGGLQVADGHPIEGSTLEVFVARGYSKNMAGLYNLAADGELAAEMDTLRAQATPEGGIEAALF